MATSLLRPRRALCLFLVGARSASTLAVGTKIAAKVDRPPTTLLGGFLGAGKTTTLTHLLTNREGLRIAVLVNDVAAVNVDAMAIRRTSIEEDGVEMVQLENGCVCCGPGSGDLAPAVLSLLERTDPPFDHVVVELSGVADPINVQSNLLIGGVKVDRKVALVDANSFPELYGTVQTAGERTDLAGEDVGRADPCAVDRRVVELLLQQLETADTILVNKCAAPPAVASPPASPATPAPSRHVPGLPTPPNCPSRSPPVSATGTQVRSRERGRAAHHAGRVPRSQRARLHRLHHLWRRSAR